MEGPDVFAQSLDCVCLGSCRYCLYRYFLHKRQPILACIFLCPNPSADIYQPFGRKEVKIDE